MQADIEHSVKYGKHSPESQVSERHSGWSAGDGEELPPHGPLLEVCSDRGTLLPFPNVLHE